MPDTTTTLAIPTLVASLHPAFQKRVLAIMQKLQSHDPSYESWLVSGYRSPEEQARIYAVGRAQPGQVYTISGITVTAPLRSAYPKWSIISKAPPYTSAHQYGLAVDFGWVINGIKKVDIADPVHWKTLYEIAQTENSEDILKSVPFDKAHIQCKAWHVVKSNLTSYISTYKHGGIKAVYEKLSNEAPASL